MTDTPEQIPQWAMEKADEFWAEIHSHKLMPFSKEKIFARALAAEVERLTAERDALKEALRQCISPICGYAIKDSAQALEVVSDFLEQIFRTSDIARKSLEASK